MKITVLLVAALLCVATPAAAQTQLVCNQGSAKVPCAAPIGLTYIPVLTTAKLPTGIPAINIGGGTVGNTPFSYIANLTSDAQAQLATLQPVSANLTALAALNSTGHAVRTGTNTWALRTFIAGAGITLTNPDGVAAATTFALTNTSITFSASAGLTLSGCSPVSLGGTCTINLGTELAGLAALSANGMIARTTTGTYASRTIAGIGGITVSNGDGVAASPSIAITYGTGSNTATQGNDARICPLSTGAGDTFFGTGSACSILAASTTHRLLHSGSSTSWGQVDLATEVSGLLPNGSLSNSSLTVAAGSGISVSGCSPVSLGGTCTVTATSATNGISLLTSSPFAITSTSYQSIGLSATLPSTGTYLLLVDLRTLINVSVGSGAYIECQLYNTTDALQIANSETIGAYAPVVAQQYYGQVGIGLVTGNTGSKVIDVQCLRGGGTTYTTSGVYNDTNGRSRFTYIKLS